MPTTYFTRAGEPVTRYALDEKGKPYTTRQDDCQRCGGAGGADKWKHTGYTCFDCNGSRKGPLRVVKLYTPEQNAKLDAAATKRDEKRQQAAEECQRQREAEATARRDAFLAEHGTLLASMEHYAAGSPLLADMHRRAVEQCKLSEAQIELAREQIAKAERAAGSQYLGKVGDRLSMLVTVERVADFERPRFGASWKSETVWIVTMRDDAGNCIVSKSPNFHPADGERFLLKAVIKEHSEYKGQKQTVVQRSKAVPVVTDVAAKIAVAG